MNYLSVTDTDGNVLVNVPVESHGRPVRIAVGQVRHRSEVWRIWAAKNSSDWYVASRSIAGIQKFSLHESGLWRYAFTEQASGYLAEGQDRALDKWQRPVHDEGIVAALAIEVRDRDVVDMEDATKPEDVIWLDPPPADHYVSIRISLLSPDVGVPNSVGGTPIEVIGLQNDQAVVIAVKVESIDPQRWAKLEEQRCIALQSTKFPDVNPGKRIALFSNDANGTRYVWDSAVLPEEIVRVES